MLLILVLFLLIVPIGALAEHKTIEEIAEAYAVGTCRGCHGKIHSEWLASAHAHSVANSIGILRDFIEWRLKRGKEVDKRQLMRCMGCHAPHLENASESLVQEVIRLVLTAADGKDEAKREEAKRSLDRLNINCIVCHNTVAILEKDLKGSRGRKSIMVSEDLLLTWNRKVLFWIIPFCGQCHESHPPDGRSLLHPCTSYQDAYRRWGGARHARIVT
jgi:cytochrome c553